MLFDRKHKFTVYADKSLLIMESTNVKKKKLEQCHIQLILHWIVQDISHETEQMIKK